MPYKLKCSTKSRNFSIKRRKSEEVSYEYSLNNDSENAFRLVLNDAFSCVIDCFVLNDTKLVNTFDMNYDAVDWLIVKRDYVDIENDESDNYQSVLKFYVQDNYTKEERYAYLTLTDNLTGDTTFLTIEQPSCIYRIEVNDKDEDYALTLSEKILQYEEDIEVKVYGGHEKLKLYNESLTTISLTKEYPVVDGKVTIDDKEYTIEDDKVTINRKVYPVEEGKVTIDYAVVNNKVIINEVEYTVVDGKLANEYPVIEDKVTIEGKEYTVEDGKVTINGVEYTVENGKVVIKYDVVDGKEYTIVEDKVTIDGTEYTVVDGKVTIDYSVVNNKVTINEVEYTVVDGTVTIGGVEYLVVDGKVTIDYPVVDNKVTIGGVEYPVVEGKVMIDYTVVNNKVTINGKEYRVVYKVIVDGVKYTVVDGKVTIDGVEYTVVNNKITINGEEYTVVNGTVIIEYPIKNSKVVIEGTEYVVVDDKVIENIEAPVEDELEREIGFKIKEMGIRQQLKDRNVTTIENGIMTRYSSYTVTVTFNGSLIDNGHKVMGYLRHYDDNNTVRKLIYEAEAPIKETNVELPESECINRQKKNKKNRLESKPLSINSNSVKKSRKKTVNTQSPIYIPLEEKYINGTEIGIVTTNKKGEHDSMITTETYAPLWCHVKTKYDYDNECHIINVKCDNNFYGKIRKTRILIRNAEVMGSIISYSVSQDTENNVTIERYQ